MNAQAPIRGAELVAGGGRIGFGPQWLARIWAGRFDRILDRIDASLVRGSVELEMPDGRTRLLGGRAPGFAASVRLSRISAVLRLVTSGSIGCYQGWEAGEWSSLQPVTLFALFVDNAAALGNRTRAHGPWRLLARFAHWLHRNTKVGASRNIHAHYDLGNDFYAAWLDPELVYSSARFDGPSRDLAAGQQRKLEKIAARLRGAGSVLEIGCGWGSLARHLADAGAAVTAISLSDAQLDWAREQHAGKAIDFRKQDYRDVTGQFDAIASVEMVEAVGREFWPNFFDCIDRCLKPGGRAVVQYISIDEQLFDAYAANADFIQSYIFPGGMLVRESTFRQLAGDRGLGWQDQENFADDYAETLRIWRENFDLAVDAGRLPAGFDARFVRLWRFYLMYCEGGFRGGGINVAQVTLVKPD
ncbi:MAG: cyclopropane-fatty-acyl-phospholipid synthase family protein [Novosphingobium sp.]